MMKRFASVAVSVVAALAVAAGGFAGGLYWGQRLAPPQVFLSPYDRGTLSPAEASVITMHLTGDLKLLLPINTNVVIEPAKPDAILTCDMETACIELDSRHPAGWASLMNAPR